MSRPEGVACCAVLVPIVVAVIRAVADRRIPIGDNALFVIRSRDVFTTDHFPFVGTASSASIGAGTGVNHPGPLLFDILAVPVALFGGTAGTAIGVGLVNMAAVVGAAVIGFRLGGRTGSLLASATAAAIAWTLGSSLLVEPWNPHVLILPCLLLLMSSAAVASGDVIVLPVLLAVASLCLQTHLSYVVIVPFACAAGLCGSALVYIRRWRRDPASRRADGPRLRRVAIMSGATIVVLWIQPLSDLFSNGREANLVELVTSRNPDEPTVGGALGVRLIAAVTALPGGWGRAAFVDAIPDTAYEANGVSVDPTGLANLGWSAAALLAMTGLVALAGALACRRRDRGRAAACAVALVALGAAFVTMVVMPIGPLGLRSHQMRWLWAIGPFITFSIVFTLMAPVADRRGSRAARAGLGFSAIAVVALCVMNVPAFVQSVGPNSENAAVPVARRLDEQVGQLRVTGSIVYDPTGSRFAEPFSTVVLAALQARGIRWTVDDEYLIRQFGESRRPSGREEFRMTVVEGRSALTIPEGSRRAAFTSPLTDDEIGELLAAEAALIDLVESYGLLLSPVGQALVDSGRYLVAPEIVAEAEVPANAAFLVESGTVAHLVADGGLLLDDDDRPLFVRAAELRHMVGSDSVAVILTPQSNG